MNALIRSLRDKAIGSGELARVRELTSRLEKRPSEKILKCRALPAFFAADLAGLDLKQQRWLVGFIASVSLISFVALVTLKAIWLFFCPFVVCTLIYCESRRRAAARARRFETDYPAFLLGLASSIRTGRDPLAAFMDLERLFEKRSEIRQALERTRERLSNGCREEEAIAEFAKDIDYSDIRLFRTAYILARKSGASLSGALQRLVRVTRQRQSFRRKVRSAIAMQRLSAIGIGFCAVSIGTIQFVTTRHAVQEALRHPVGCRAYMLALVLMVSGLFWMGRLGRLRFN